MARNRLVERTEWIALDGVQAVRLIARIWYLFMNITPPCKRRVLKRKFTFPTQSR